MLVKIVAISDLHGDLMPDRMLPDGDVLVIAGDILPDDFRDPNRDQIGTTRIIRQGWWFDDVFIPWLRELEDHYTWVIFIGGNHDFFFQSMPTKYIEDQLPKHVTYLNETSVTVDGVKFYGAPWACTVGWAFFTEEEAYEEKLALVPPVTDVIIVHGPPASDIIRPLFHYCSTALGRWVYAQHRLKALICGHIHEAYGSYTVGVTPVHVVSSKDRQYRMVNNPIIIEVTKDAE